MTDVNIDQHIKRGHLRLIGWERFFHYIASWGFLLFTPLIIYTSFRNKGTVTKDDLYFIVFTLGLSGLLYATQRTRLKFTTDNIDLSKEQILDVINKAGEEMKWTFETVKHNYIKASSNRLFNIDHTITIIIVGQKVMVNVRASSGDIFGHSRDSKLTDSVMTSLRMKGYEIKKLGQVKSGTV